MQTDIFTWDKLKTADGQPWEGGSEPYRKDLPAGAWDWRMADDGKTRYLNFTCPCGCGVASMIPVTTVPGGHGWKWDGNEEKPTLSPSIQKLTPCRWHGYLRAGIFEKC